jgi:hypothetical protein
MFQLMTLIDCALFLRICGRPIELEREWPPKFVFEAFQIVLPLPDRVP